MNMRTTLIVVLVAIGLLGYVLVFETDLVFDRAEDTTTTPTGDVSGRPLLEDGKLRPGRIASIMIEQPDALPLVAERDPNRTGDWRQTEPVTFDLKDHNLEDLADAITELRYTNLVTDARSNKYGLDQPSHTITITGQRDGRTLGHKLRLGRTGAAGRAYLRLDDDDAVYVVDDSLHELLLGKKLTTWRETSLPRIDPGRVEAIQLDQKDGSVTLVERHGAWAFEGDATGRVDTEAAEGLVNVVNYASIREFIVDHPADLKPYGLDDPRYTLTLRQRQADPNTPGERYRLRIGNTTDLSGDKVYAMWNNVPTVFTLGAKQIADLAQGVDELRDARLTPVRAANVRAIDIHDRGDDHPKLSFVLDEGEWRFSDAGSNPKYNVEPSRVEQLLKALTQTEAQAFGGDAAFTTEVRLKVTGRTVPEVLHIGRADDGSLRVLRNDEPIIYHVDAADLALVFESPVAFRDRTVIDIAPEQVAGLSIQRNDPPATYALSRTPADGNLGPWQLEGYDRTAVINLLDALHPLEAVEWLEVHTMELLPESITLTMADGSERIIRFDANHLLVDVQGESGRCRVAPATMDALTAEFRKRRVIDLELEGIASVTSGGRTIGRDADGMYHSDDGQPIDEAGAGALFDTLAGLHAQRFVPADWAGVEVDAPTFALEIRPRNGEAIRLQVWRADATGQGVAIGRVDGGELFTLTPTQFEKLTAWR